ncbi:polynucleotide 5'-hydroxyl-kinase GRC3/NOL9 [Methanophagales archaeon]|nr:polynucleotide 5'-hydroxyl-kinase GRC3/NOL9 [Methanophagales archaeon]
MKQAIEDVVENVLRQEQKQVVIFMLGDVDVGKTYTVTSIANVFFAHGLKVAVVDTDVGQSDIGPPCCIGMGIQEKELRTLSEVPLHSLYFVGTTSPNRSTHDCVKGAAAAVAKAKELGADVIIVDSTGWIEGEDAKRFKLFEIKEIEPALVIAIERENEVGHILTALNMKVIKLAVSSEVRSRSRDERKALREEAYNRYFSTAKTSVFDPPALAWTLEEGTIMGLYNSKDDENEIVGLGILMKWDYEQGKVIVSTPVDDTEKGMEMKTGGLKLIKANGKFKEARVYNFY